jgi:3-deoxy-D-manno-octulosonic-acid transferase
VHKTENDFLGAVCSQIYSALWYPALPFALLAAGGKAEARDERRGGAPPGAARISEGKVRVWLHAASVGEIEGVRPVVQNMMRLRPDVEFVITTMTTTGRDAARRRLNGTCQLAPFDHPAAVRAFVARTRPALLIITETELWPNFFLESTAAGAAVALINARISSRSMSRYRFIRPLIARALQSASIVLAQTAEDGERLCQLGAAPGRVAITGNTKYEIAATPTLRAALAAFAIGQPILVAGSTAPGEEQIVLAAYRKLSQRFPSLALVLAPRHLQRLGEVERILHTAGVGYLRASVLDSPTTTSPAVPPAACGSSGNLFDSEYPIPLPDQERGEPAPRSESDVSVRRGLSGNLSLKNNDRICTAESRASSRQVLLLDTMGELSAMYQRATVALVGGSMVPGRGGQSLAEPANASVPVLFGPYYENHRQLGDALLAAEAGRVVRNASELADATTEWLADPVVRTATGQRARSVIERLAGGTVATVRYLCALLAS